MTRDHLILSLIIDKLRHWKDRRIMGYIFDDDRFLAPIEDKDGLPVIVNVEYRDPVVDEDGFMEIGTGCFAVVPNKTPLSQEVLVI